MEEKNDGVGKPSQEEEDILFTKGLKKKGWRLSRQRWGRMKGVEAEKSNGK
jgi:hypothetical protein